MPVINPFNPKPLVIEKVEDQKDKVHPAKTFGVSCCSPYMSAD